MSENPFQQVKVLYSKQFELRQLEHTDFEPLFSVASNPQVWEQHPEHDRWKRDKFQRFFDGALENYLPSYTIIDREQSSIIGSSRYYDYYPDRKAVSIGYTFIDPRYWGTSANKEIKTIMLTVAFRFVDMVCFDIGPNNFRSRRAVEKIGACFSHAVDENKVVYVLTPASCSLNFESELLP
jgi:RimJ/RimL family protein N-acetyltransferase